MNNILTHVFTPELVIIFLGVFLLVALVSYLIAYAFFREFFEAVRERLKGEYWLTHIVLYIAWCAILFVLFGLINT